MGKFRKSSDKTYTIFDKIANKIRVYKPSAKVQETVENFARNTLKALAAMYLSKTISKTKVKKEVTSFIKKTAKELGKDIKEHGI